MLSGLPLKTCILIIVTNYEPILSSMQAAGIGKIRLLEKLEKASVWQAVSNKSKRQVQNGSTSGSTSGSNFNVSFNVRFKFQRQFQRQVQISQIFNVRFKFQPDIQRQVHIST